MSYNYLASPYSHRDTAMMESRYEAALEALGWLLKRKIWTYSPIVHCHTLARHKDLPTDANYWIPFNRAMLKLASTLIILKIDGWDISAGIKLEMKWAAEDSIPINSLRPLGGDQFELVTLRSDHSFL